MIPLEWYRRPKPNSRMCMHGTADQYSPWGFDIRFWLELVKRMGCSWAKGLSCPDGVSGAKWVPIAFDLGLEPVVRIYSPMPYLLDETKKNAIRLLRSFDVLYFEGLNEPGNRQEWHHGSPPANWADIAAQNFIDFARFVQSVGGVPLLPALSTGSPMAMVDLSAKIIDFGGADVFDGPIVYSEHNYPLNHSIGLSGWGQTDTYPRDSVNQQGEPVSFDLYNKVGGYGWDGRSQEWVNQRRQDRMNPGATMWEDNCGEISLWFHAELAKRTLEERLDHWTGYPAMLVTEGGFVIGDSQDDRYPRNTPEYVKDGNVELALRCQGISKEHGGSLNYPDYVLAGAGYWLLHNDGGPPNWNSQAWKGMATLNWPSNFREGDQLHSVRALIELPKHDYGSPDPPDLPDPPDPPDIPEPPDHGELPAGWEIPPDLPMIKPEYAEPEPGTLYYRLTEARGPFKGRHWVSVDVLDRFGKRKVGTEIYFASAETLDSGVLEDKPLDFGMYGVLGSYSVYIKGVSDKITGLGLGSAAQPNWSHHFGYEVAFQETLAKEEPLDPPPPPDDMVLLVPTLPESRVQDWRHRLPARIKDGVPMAWGSRPWLEVKAKSVGFAVHWADDSGYDYSLLEIADYQTGEWTHYPFSEVAYHLCVRQDGLIEWGLPLEDDPRHVGNESLKWLSILVQPAKMEVDGEEHWWITPEQVEATRNLWNWIGYGINRPLILKGHNEVTSGTECPGPDWTENKRRILEGDPAYPGSGCEEKLRKARENAADIKPLLRHASDLTDEIIGS